VDLMDAPGWAAHQAAQQHLTKVWEALYAQEEAEDGEDIDSPAFGPFCGCETCVIRETLAAAWPVIEEYFRRLYDSTTG
jgi:hypothetical protein